MYLSALFIAKNFKIQSYENVPFLDPKWPFYHEGEFFSENPLIHLVAFVHGYLHATNQSQMSMQ